MDGWDDWNISATLALHQHNRTSSSESRVGVVSRLAGQWVSMQYFFPFDFFLFSFFSRRVLRTRTWQNGNHDGGDMETSTNRSYSARSLLASQDV